MAKKSMSEYAKAWKSPDQKRGEHRDKMDRGAPEPKAKKDAPKAKGKDSDDSKGPGPGDWRKGNKTPKSC